MKKTEYALNPVQSTHEVHEVPAKQDDQGLPEFSKEVPISSKKREDSEGTIIENAWKESKTNAIRVKSLTIRKGEDLEKLYRIPAVEGTDSVTFKHDGVTYIVRKTSREVAQALYKVYLRVGGIVENVVGYLRTMLGNYYVISKVEKEGWCFDERIAAAGVNYVNSETIGTKGKSSLIEMITEKVSELHSHNLIIGKFTLNNLLIEDNDLLLTDLRRMRVSRKRSFVVDEFIGVLQYLFGLSIASREDVYQSVAYYASRNEDGCVEWFEESRKKRPKDLFEAVVRIEERIYS